MALPQWTEKTGLVLAEIDERTNVSIPLPLADSTGVTVTVIAGELPPGLRIAGTNIQGVAFEVSRSTEFEFVLRASTVEGILDRTFVIRVDGEDTPVWQTPEGALNLKSTLRNQYWIDIANTGWGIFTIGDGTGLFESKDVSVVETIPAQTSGSAGDIVFVYTREQFWYKASNRWVLLSSNELKGVLGPDTDIIVSAAAPSPIDYDYWWNLQKTNSGLSLNLKFYDENVPVWRPVEYFVGPSAPLAPFDNQVWIHVSETAFEYTIKIYDQTEKVWNILNPIYDTTPPDRVNKAFFVLDSSPVDFQLQALDSDLRAGESLYYYIADGEGTLPPGLTLDATGRISGIVDPLLALDVNAEPGYDSGEYDDNIYDFLVVDDNGYDSFFYDTTFYGFSSRTRRPKKLNREYTFSVTVEDDVSNAKRQFTIYVVGDDFLRSDNTIMKSGTGIFTADATFLRKPIFLTPGNFGFKRANNYLTFFIEVFDPNTILGELSYSLKDFNDDGTVSEIPPGMVLDGLTGEIAGLVPYQPAINKEYKFTIEALRQDVDVNDIVEVNAFIDHDTLAGSSSLRIAKLPISIDDGVDDLLSFTGADITIENIVYSIKDVNGDNAEFDILNLDRPLEPTFKSNPITLHRNADIGQEYIYVKNIDEKSKDFWKNKTLYFSESEQYKLVDTVNTDNVFKTFIEYTITSDDSADGLDWSYDDSGFTPAPGDTLENLLTRYITDTLGYNSTEYEIYSVQDKEITFAILADSVTRNRNTFKEVIYTTDSAYDVVNVVKSEDFIRIPISTLQRNLIKNQQYALGALENTLITNKLSVTNVGTIAAIKTFTVEILGEVDSTIEWITDADLGSINANRISYLYLEATTTLEGSNLRYDIIEGRLPNGLSLRRNGEIVGKAQQYGTNGLTFIDQGQNIWTASQSYVIGNTVQLGDNIYIAISDHTASVDNSPISTDAGSYWQQLNQRTTFDGGNTSLDRKFVFKVIARDRFGYSASIKEFTLTVNDSDNKLYSNVYMQPYPIINQKTLFSNFVNDYKIFDPAYIYRPSDPNFGVRKDLRTLAYAGIEQKSIHNFMAAIARNHKKKKFYFGDIKTAVAKLPGTEEILYEVVYVEIIDPQEPKVGSTPLEIKTRNAQRLTVNDVKLEAKDDVTAQEEGQDIFTILLRTGLIAKFNAGTGTFIVVSRAIGNVDVDVIEGKIPIETRDGLVVNVESISLTTDNSGDAFRFRPKSAVVSADSQGYKVSQNQNIRRFVSNIGNMRKRIEEIGANEREFLPLWMRSSQETATQEIDYVTAMVLCYCKPNTSTLIKENIEQSKFIFNQINYEIDRYIVDGTAEKAQEQFLLFANYKFNV